jgi:hypothetical protein
MYSRLFLVLAAISSYCYAQQAASDVVTSLDAITQSLSDATVLVNAVSSNEETEVCRAQTVLPFSALIS